MSVKKLIQGVGINDADYLTKIGKTVGYSEKGERIQKTIWRCPFYRKWESMLQRCYSRSYQDRYPTYNDCFATPEWHYFMTFRAWMEGQDWENKHLDKDLLVPNNKVYGPDTCLFVDEKVNLFISDSKSKSSSLPTGVNYRVDISKYRAGCKDCLTGKQKYLGLYDTPEEAHQAWLTFKLEQAYILAAEQTDPRVAKALIDRYENYGKFD